MSRSVSSNLDLLIGFSGLFAAFSLAWILLALFGALLLGTLVASVFGSIFYGMSCLAHAASIKMEQRETMDRSSRERSPRR